MDALSGGTDLQLTIQQLNPLKIARPGVGDDAQTESALNSFGDLLKSELNKISQTQEMAGEAVQTYAAGGDIELHQVITSVEKADLSLQLATQIRNKLVGAYQELSRMQV
ncbi:MAG: flagellar hook-basal body complex protein FliE [Vampirovibrionales bacterium]|nr:flagellar hook-basal body complex protein FliE [Vampirovibrionales bacterium]